MRQLIKTFIVILGAVAMIACTDVEMQLPKGPQGERGAEGLSAYEVWVKAVKDGTIKDWTGSTEINDYFIYLKGKDGADGKDGSDGKTAYEVWVEMVKNHELEDPKNPGTLWPDDKISKRDFYDFLTGRDGDDGNTPYIGENGNWWIVVDGVPTDLNVPARGKDGVNGKDGKDGADGKNGVDGKDGKDGVNGKDGADGSIPYIGDNGNWWIVVDGIPKDLGVPAKGQDGKDGANGKDGINGKDGKDGANGKDGINGKDGKDGADGKDGINGKDGKDGADGKDGINGKDGKDGKNGKSAYELWKDEVLSAEGLEDPKNPGNKWDKTKTSLQDFWEYLRGSDGKDGKDGLIKTEFIYVDYDKSKYNVVPVKSLKRINGSDTTYEYVNPLSGGVAYLVSGPGPVIIPNAKIKAMDEKGVSYEWKSDESGYIYVDCDELPEWADDGRHGGRLLSIKSLSFGEKSIDEASLIADNTFIPYRVSLIAKLTTPSFNDYNSVRINWAAKRVYEGMQQDWPAQNYYYNISESDLKELRVQKVNLSLPVPEGYAVCSDSIDMSSAEILHSPLVSRHISYDKDGYPAFPTYAYVVVGDGKNPSTVKVHENVFKDTGTATNPNLTVKYQADYGCRTSSFDNGRDMVIAPELCEFGQLDTTRSRYVVKIGETILFLMFDTKTFGHIYSSEVYDVPESERTRSDLGKLYAFRRYENLADFTERLKINYEVTGRIGVIGYLNEILISNSTDYGLKNFNETKDSVQFEIKNAYDKFTVNYYNLYARTIRGGFLFPLFDSARGKFSYHMGDSTATITIEKKKFTIPAEVQEYIK